MTKSKLNEDSVTKKVEEPVFKDTDEYVDFAKKYKVFGNEAIKLKKEMIKQYEKQVKK